MDHDVNFLRSWSRGVIWVPSFPPHLGRSAKKKLTADPSIYKEVHAYIYYPHPILFQTYVSEISHPDWRSTFGAGIGLCFLIGTLVIHILGAICNWRTLAWVSIIFPVLSFMAGLLSPESPTWLVTKGTY